MRDYLKSKDVTTWITEIISIGGFVLFAYIGWALVGTVIWFIFGDEAVRGLPLTCVAVVTGTTIAAFLFGRDYEDWQRHGERKEDER